MKSLISTLTAGFGLLVLCAPAWALFDTNELLSVCESGLQNPVKVDPKYAFCTGAILGILMTDAMEKDLICAPSDLDTKAAIRLFVQRARREPHKDIEGLVTMYRAFLEAYPCKKQ